MGKYYDAKNMEYVDTDSAKEKLNISYGRKVDSNELIEHRLSKVELHKNDFEPDLQCVFDEAKALNKKICKLRNYLFSKTEPDNAEFSRAEMREEAFARQQLVFMEGYLEMLLCRMEMWC